MKFQIVDAFTENIFGGNPAGIVLIDDGKDFPEDKLMVKTAAELRYSETAFIKKLSDKIFHIRYFTPAAEVDLCGHATIGSFKALKNWGLAADGNTYTIKTLAGDLKIELDGGSVFMEMGKPELLKTIDSESEIEKTANILRIKKEEIVRPINIISTGLPDIMLEVSSINVLNSIKPDFPALSELSRAYGVTGLHAAYFKGESNLTAHCRNFAPLYEIDEEAATGTSNGSLTYHFYLQDKISEGIKNTFIQGEAMGRPSKIVSFLTKSYDDVKIQIGGTATVLASGDIQI